MIRLRGRAFRAPAGATALVLLAAGVAGCTQPAASAATPERNVACTAAARESGSTRAVVAAARAFAASLEPAQRAKLSHPFELQYAIRWSNFPAALVPRNGIPFGEMSPRQAAAAEQLIAAAAGACGARLFDENRQADVVGHKVLPQVGPEWHYVSFNGEPSEAGPWMLMVSGHHLDFNFVFNGRQPGATPLFAGSDPARFTNEQGVETYPMARQGGALAAMATAAARYPEAKLPGVYTDLVKSVTSFGGGPPRGAAARPPGAPRGAGPPGGFGSFAASGRGMDTQFPQTYPTGPNGRGVAYAKLAPAEQVLVRRAIEAYAALAGRALAQPLLALYETPEALAETYVAYSGDPNLVQPNAYVRIDGPRVWIELSVQESLISPEQTHFHSLWRDKLSDYGGEFRSAAAPAG